MIALIVRKYQAVFVFAFMSVLMGLMSYCQLPREAAPEIRRPMIFVTTIYPGVAPADMETLVTEEIEAEIEGLAGLEKLTSSSESGLSLVTAEFSGDTDVETALRRVKERVDIAKTKIPRDAEEPIVKELNFSDQPFLILTLSNPDGLERLEELADIYEDGIKKVEGVLDVVVSGKLEREMKIMVDPTKLRTYGFSLGDVKQTIQNENRTIPGGLLETKTKNFSLVVSGKLVDEEGFGNLVVRKNGRSARLKDLGVVKFDYKDPDSISRLAGEPAISLAVKKRGGANLLQIVEEVRKFIDQNSHKIPPKTKLAYPHDESKDVKMMVADLENNIFTGLLLVLVVTWFFLGPVNASFVSLAIPFSMLISFFVLSILGITLNMVVLFSLVIALGMLVDNGIVIVENVYRHSSLGKNRVQAAIDGTREIAMPITTSTLTTILAFFPIIFMPDIMGEFMSYLPKTVIIVLASSLVVGLSITTVFCSRFLKASKEDMAKISGSEEGYFRKIETQYKKVLVYALGRPWRTLFAAIAFVFVGMVLNSMFGREALFFPTLDPKVGLLKVKLDSGRPLEDTDAFTRPLEKIVDDVPSSIDIVQTTIGDRQGEGGARQSHRSSIRINFKPFIEREILGNDTLQDIRKRVAQIPGAQVIVDQLKEGPPQGNDISYEVLGHDYEEMGVWAAKVQDIIDGHKRVLDRVDSDFEAAKPEIQVNIDRQKAGEMGLDASLIASTIRTAMGGSKESTFRIGKNEYDVTVMMMPDDQKLMEDLRGLEIVTDEARIPLSTVAEIVQDSSVGVIKRKARQRTVTVFADFLPEVQGKDLVIKDIEQKISALNPPPGYSVVKGEGQAVRQKSTQFLLQAFIVALFLIFLVMVLQFNSVTQPMIILTSVFLSLGGVFWGIFLTRQVFVIIMSGIGVISLAGVVVNNAIVLIDFINQTKARGMAPREAIISASQTRLRPVLLTAITTIIGMLPMAFGVSFDFHTFTLQVGSESTEWWSPMAWTIIFGLSFATVLTLVVVPCLTLLSFRLESRGQKAVEPVS